MSCNDRLYLQHEGHTSDDREREKIEAISVFYSQPSLYHFGAEPPSAPLVERIMCSGYVFITVLVESD